MPSFLKLRSDLDAGSNQAQGNGEANSPTSTRLYSEIALKNAKFTPLYPLRASVVAPVASSAKSRPVVQSTKMGEPVARPQADHDEDPFEDDMDDEDDLQQKQAQAINIAFLQPRSVNLAESDAIAIQD